jgi:hypothetical protein
LSALRAIDSADARRLVLEIFFIQLLFCSGRFPQRHEVIVFSIFVVPDFKNQRVETAFDPANRAILIGKIDALV